MLVTRARDNSCLLALCNAVGGQDELIFDGHSVVIDDEGQVLARAPGFEEALLVVDVEPSEVIGRRLSDVRRRALARERRARRGSRAVELGDERATRRRVEPAAVAPFDDLEQMRLALELGAARLRGQERLRRRRRRRSRAGSTRRSTAALAAEALGPERVHCVSMPSRYSSEGTRSDARRLAESLGGDFRELPIEEIVGGVRRRARRPSRAEPRPRRTCRPASAACC